MFFNTLIAILLEVSHWHTLYNKKKWFPFKSAILTIVVILLVSIIMMKSSLSVLVEDWQVIVSTIVVINAIPYSYIDAYHKFKNKERGVTDVNKGKRPIVHREKPRNESS